MGDQQRTLGDFGRRNNQPRVVMAYQQDEANANFEIKPSLLNTLKQNQFAGEEIEDPNQHLMTFYEICDTFMLNGVTEGSKKLRLFPFTLRDRAKDWLHTLPQGSIAT